MKALIAEVDNETFETKLLSLDTTRDTNYALWKIAKRKPPKYSPAIKTTTGEWTRSDTEKAAVFASHFEKVFQPNDITTDIVPTPARIEGPAITSFTPREIKLAIDKLKTKKTPGIDQITGQGSSKESNSNA